MDKVLKAGTIICDDDTTMMLLLLYTYDQLIGDKINMDAWPIHEEK